MLKPIIITVPVELGAGLAWVDLVDQNGTPLHLDQAGAAKASTIVTLREQYSVVAICTHPLCTPDCVLLMQCDANGCHYWLLWMSRRN